MSLPKFGLRTAVGLFAFLLIFSINDAQAQKERASAAFEILDDVTPENYSYKDGRRIESRTGTLRSWPNPNQAFSGTPEQVAEQFMKKNFKQLNLADRNLGDLRHLKTIETLSGHTVRYEQHVQGVKVMGGRISISMDKNNTVTFVGSDYKSDVAVSSVAPSFTALNAGENAKSRLNSDTPLHFDETELVVYYNRGQSALAHKSNQVVTSGLAGEWETITDAGTGQIISQRDISFYHTDKDKKDDKKVKKSSSPTPVRMMVNGTGAVFDPDPVSSALATYRDPGYVDGADADTPQLIAEQQTVTILDITFDGTNYILQGPWASIEDAEAPFNGLFAQASSDFSTTRNNDLFEAANVYFHIDHSMRHLNNTLGLDLLTPASIAL